MSYTGGSMPSEQGGVEQVNQQFYDALWSGVRLIKPSRFNTWPLVQSLTEQAEQRLEVGPGMRPRLPIGGTHFVDISAPALQQLAREGGLSQAAPITALPFADN